MKFNAGTISGELTAYTIHSDLAAVKAWASSGKTFKFESISKCDSSAVALLIEISRSAQASGKKCTLEDLPQSVKDLNAFFEVEPVLSQNLILD